MKICWAQYLFWLVILVLGAGSALSACGQKGDLYLPEPSAPKKQTAPEKKPSANQEPSAANNEPSS